MAAGSTGGFFELLGKSHVFSQVVIVGKHGAVPGGLGALDSKV